MKAPNKYLINAAIEWILDNEMTPYAGVNATMEGVVVPQHAVQDGRIVLDLSPTSIRDYHIDEKGISFSARFQGKAEMIYLPIESVALVFAKENGMGIPLPMIPKADDDGNDDDNNPPPKGKPKLSIV